MITNPPFAAWARQGRSWIPRDDPGCFFWLRSDLGVTVATGKVSAWANQGSAGGSFTQPTASKQPTYSASGSWPTITWSNANQTALLSSNISKAASDYLWFFAVNPTLTTATSGLWLLDILTGRLILTQENVAGGGVAFFNGSAYQGVVSATTGKQILAFELISGGTTNAKIDRNNTSISSGLNYSTQRAVGGSIGLGTSAAGSAAWFDGDIMEVVGTSSTDSATRNRISKYLGARYGITVA